MSSWFETCVHYLRHSLVIIGALLVVGVVGGLIFMYSGVFNVAASMEDSSVLNWVLVTVRESSIKLHARDVVAPLDKMVADTDNGFRLYRQECAMCHTPVGRSPKNMAVGFNPQAPRFDSPADVMSTQEVFWVTKHGIRFTGMPAWGPSLTDKEILDVTAFITTLFKMKAADYDAIDARLPAIAVKP